MAEIEPNRSSNRAWHLVATLPTGLFILLHLMTRVAPPVLWGADGLVYYGPLVTAAFIALPAATLSLPRFLLPPSVRQAVVGALSYRWLPWALLLGSVPLFWLGRVRTHTLGDSIKWFAGDVAVWQYRPFSEIPWHNDSLDVPGLEFINFQQTLDLINTGAVTQAWGRFNANPDRQVEGPHLNPQDGGGGRLKGRLSSREQELLAQSHHILRLWLDRENINYSKLHL